MEPHYADDLATLYHGDCREVLAELPDCSVDAVVTDPPYGLEFMGKDWDAPWKGDTRQIGDSSFQKGRSKHGQVRHGLGASYGGNAQEKLRHYQSWMTDVAAECLRVLKPGGHLLAFGGTRTWHRMAVAIEDAGFEIRDSIAWMYGSGFPKSLDVSKAIDKKRDDRADVLRVTAEIARLRDEAGLTNRALDDVFGFAGMAGHWTSTKSQPTVPTVDQWARLRDLLNPDPWLDDEIWRLNGRKGTPGESWSQRAVIGQRQTGIGTGRGAVAIIGDGGRDITAPATDAAQNWQGWGTALKPAFEPVVVARKPLIGTVAENVLEHGTGALNIDGCRIGNEARTFDSKGIRPGAHDLVGDTWEREANPVTVSGRWPANVILDEDQAAALDQQSGYLKPATSRTHHRNRGPFTSGSDSIEADAVYQDGGGGASRFFYVPKANRKERPTADGIAHPTVKPLALMTYLIRLVTPPGGIVLDPFAGSGTTLEAATVEGFRSIGIELTPEYLPLIEQRLRRNIQPTLDTAS